MSHPNPSPIPAELPLLPPSAISSIVAWREGQGVTYGQFVADVMAVSAALPPLPYVMNLCQSRYAFAVVWLASIARGIVNIFPNSPAPEHLATLARERPHQIVVGDTPDNPCPLLPYVHVDELMARSEASTVPDVPRIAADQMVAQIYTSGSTGQPQAHAKRFGYVLHSVQAAARRLWAATGGVPCSVVGTSSFRHMFGLESAVLLPLFTGGVMSDRQPFFPDDIVASLDELPEPRLLVTTPFHLRKLMEREGHWPRLHLVLSATAPLATPVAAQAEQMLNTQVWEIYGATESGQIATRHTTRDAAWDLLDGLSLRAPAESGHDSERDMQGTTGAEGRWQVTGGSQWQPQWLNDWVEPLDDTRFRLVDRLGNLINIVGKRTTLSHLNHVLTTQVPGVRDGVFCLPPGFDAQDNARLAAFVVAPGVTTAHIQQVLRQHIDAVFLPRPLVPVDDIPRDLNGKVTAAGLQRLMATHLPQA